LARTATKVVTTAELLASARTGVDAFARRLAGRLRRGSPHAWDALLAAALVAGDFVGLARVHALLAPQGEIASWPVLVAIMTLRGSLLALRRRFPVAVSVVVSATLISVPTHGLDNLWQPAATDPGWWPFAFGYGSFLEGLVGVYTVTAFRGRRDGCLAAVWLVLCGLPILVAEVLVLGPAPILFLALPAALAVGLGDVRRRIVAARAEVSARTRRISEGRARQAEEAVQTERERLAGELQGLVATSLGRMVEQARRASNAVEAEGGSVSAREAIRAVERTGRAALADARRGLGLLRRDGGVAPLRPVPAVTHHGGEAHEERGRQGPVRAPIETISRLRPTGADLALAASLQFFLLSELGGASSRWPHQALGILTHPTDLLAVVALAPPLALRRIFPLGVSLVVSAAFAAHGASWHFFGLAELMALLIGVYSVWAEGGLRRGLVAAAAAGMAAPFGAAGLDTHAFSVLSVFVPLLPGACFFGWQERTLSLTMGRLQEQEAELRRLTDAELERARTEERLRIARELHDVTAHSLSVMTIQAGAARTVAGSRPHEALRALSDVEETGRRAQAELEEVFAAGVLPRTGGADAAPGIDALPALARQMQGAGLTVDLDVSPPPVALSPGLDLSLYRVVQEALTNAAKHAGPTRVRVSLRTDSDTLLLEVADEGPVTASSQGPPDIELGGRGLIGMRERVRAFGGTLAAGRRDGDGFTVTVRVPLAVDPSAGGGRIPG
jgi:signal transduction histidine kinase